MTSVSVTKRFSCKTPCLFWLLSGMPIGGEMVHTGQNATLVVAGKGEAVADLFNGSIKETDSSLLSNGFEGANARIR